MKSNVKIIFNELDHVEYHAPRPETALNRLYLKGEPERYMNWFGNVKIRKNKTYTEDMYGSPLQELHCSPMTKSEVMRIYDIKECQFGKDGIIYTLPEVWVCFKDGSRQWKKFDSETEALKYYESFKGFLKNETEV